MTRRRGHCRDSKNRFIPTPSCRGLRKKKKKGKRKLSQKKSAVAARRRRRAKKGR